MTEKQKLLYEKRFRELSAKLDAPEVQARAEALTRRNIDRAARIHNRILLRSRALGYFRIVV